MSPDEVADILAAQIAAGVPELRASLATEPSKAPKLPMVSQMFKGFLRAGLETPELSGTPIKDPLGGRSWVYQYATRLWVAMKSSEVEAQKEAQQLTYKVIRALEADKSLGGIADDSAMSTGDLAVVAPKIGLPMLMVTIATQVEITEAR